MTRAVERRVPARLVHGLRTGIEAGRLSTGTLAWLLNVKPATLELDEPETDDPDLDTLTTLRGLLSDR